MRKIHDAAPKLVSIAVQITADNVVRARIERDEDGKQLLPQYNEQGFGEEAIPLHEDGLIELRTALAIGEIPVTDIREWPKEMQELARADFVRLVAEMRAAQGNVNETAKVYRKLLALTQRAANECGYIVVVQEEYTTKSKEGRVFTQHKRVLLVNDDRAAVDEYIDDNQAQFRARMEVESGAAFLSADF